MQEIIKQWLEEKAREKEETEKLLVREEIMERFIRREILSSVSATKGDEALAAIQGRIKAMKASIKANDKFVAFLKEIENE